MGCGAPNRGMGWYHAVQMLEGRYVVLPKKMREGEMIDVAAAVAVFIYFLRIYTWGGTKMERY